MDERTFTFDDLERFVTDWDYYSTDFQSACQFTAEFAERMGVNFDAEKAREKWANRHGFTESIK